MPAGSRLLQVLHRCPELTFAGAFESLVLGKIPLVDAAGGGEEQVDELQQQPHSQQRKELMMIRVHRVLNMTIS
jgi:hypothetical protein